MPGLMYTDAEFKLQGDSFLINALLHKLRGQLY